MAALSAPVTFQTVGEPTDAPSASADHLTLPDAVRLAVANDPDLQIALAKVRSAEADAKQARLLPNPVLTVIVRFREGGGSPIIQTDLTADLVSLLKKPEHTRAADRHLRAAAADALSAVIDLVAQVEQAYAAVQTLDAHVAILAERRSLLDRLSALAENRLKAGEGTRLDVTLAQTERVNLEAEVADREVEQVAARLTLARLIGRPSDPARWTLQPRQGPAVAAGDERAWVLSALANRPDVRAKYWELAALGDEEALASWDLLQGLNAGVEAERDVEWSLGPNITTPIPLFDWGQASKAKARAARVQARHELTKARRLAVEETRAAYAAFVASRAALERMRSQLIPLQEARRKQAEDLYRAGESDITQLLIAEQALQDARSKGVDLEQKAISTWSKLHRAVGGHGVAAEVGKQPAGPAAPAPGEKQP